MGLAASQAKLLSITTRLSDNELRSQTITAAKMALANQTSAASKKYINALNSTELLYGTYDMNGNKTTIALTGTALSEYAPLKNQYALVNSAGQVLVSETQANYYEKSSNINDFLQFNGVKRIDTGETRTVTNTDYEEAYNAWKEKYEAWLTDPTRPDPNDFKYMSKTFGTVYEQFVTAADSCFNNATTGSYSTKCYIHVLAHMIDLSVNGENAGTDYPKSEITTTGVKFKIETTYVNDSAINDNHQTPNMLPVSDAIRDGYYIAELGKTIILMAAEDTDTTAAVMRKDTLIQAYNDYEAGLITEQELNGKRLLSNYKYAPETGEATQKTLYEKCKDIFYAIWNYAKNNNEYGFDYQKDLIPIIKSFQPDMELAFKNTANFDEDWEEWITANPEPILTEPPTIEETIYEYSDADKAQWYVNLWHRMNGASDEKNGTQTDTTVNSLGDWNEVIHNENTSTTVRWAVLEDGLMNSSKWLQNALTQGTVTLEQVQFTGESTESNTGLKEVSWKSIIYSSSQEITEQTDDNAIAKAEAEYEQAQNDIEAKDKQFDNMLKLLDTEHEALQTEYESVQQVINKNIQRTLKIYSA